MTLATPSCVLVDAALVEDAIGVGIRYVRGKGSRWMCVGPIVDRHPAAGSQGLTDIEYEPNRVSLVPARAKGKVGEMWKRAPRI